MAEDLIRHGPNARGLAILQGANFGGLRWSPVGRRRMKHDVPGNVL